jgi:hypothetical protein
MNRAAKFDPRSVRSIEIVISGTDHMPESMTAVHASGDRYEAVSIAINTVFHDGVGDLICATGDFGDPKMKVAVLVAKEVLG